MVRRRILRPRAPRPGSYHVREGTADDQAFVRLTSDRVFAQFGDYASFLPSYLEHPSVFTVIAEARGKPAGFLMLALVASTRRLPWEGEDDGDNEDDPDEDRVEQSLDAELLAIAVAPEHQSRRCGSRLMEYAITCAEGWHDAVAARSLQLNVADSNRGARRFFARWGFAEVDPFDGVYPEGQRSIRMARRLGPRIP